MRIIDMRPEITPFKAGTSRKVGKWSYEDKYVPIGGHVRSIFHYSTHMLDFVGFVGEQRCIDAERGEYEDVIYWHAEPVSIGHGSVSDQGGMNQLMSKQFDWGHRDKTLIDYGYYYARDQRGGGARIITTTGSPLDIGLAVID